jgi:hypothetical protein
LAADAAARSLLLLRVLTDTAAVGDAASRSFNGARAVGDTAPASDSAAPVPLNSGFVADSAFATDAAARNGLVFIRIVLDAAACSDVATAHLRQWEAFSLFPTLTRGVYASNPAALGAVTATSGVAVAGAHSDSPSPVLR